MLESGITWRSDLLKSKSRSIRKNARFVRCGNIQIITQIMVKKRLARQAQVQQTETWESKRTIW